ncbi:MAG TPA: hypothetical protein VF395_20840 [Polyangiaceae bacterium]
MKHASSFASALALSSLVVACGSADTRKADVKTLAPADVKTTTQAAACDMHSGYDGDDLCIPPPSADEGIQLHAGPTSYDDPDALAPYLIAAGDENVRCFNAAVPEGNFYYLSQKNRMRPNSHHMLINLGTSSDLKEGPTTACDLSSSAGSVPGSQAPSRDFPDNLGPEDAGLARFMPDATMASFQLHYVNLTDKPVLREAWVNLYKKPESEVTASLRGIFLVGDLAANIPAQSRQTTTLEYTPRITESTRIFELNGHMHAHTETFTVWRIGAGGQKDEIYKSFDWAEPKELTFNSVVQNPLPNEASREDGGLSGLFYLEPGDTLQWACDVNNDTDLALHFANEAHTAEMCLLAGGYVSDTAGLMSGACAAGKCIGGAVKPTG